MSAIAEFRHTNGAWAYPLHIQTSVEVVWCQGCRKFHDAERDKPLYPDRMPIILEYLFGAAPPRTTKL